MMFYEKCVYGNISLSLSFYFYYVITLVVQIVFFSSMSEIHIRKTNKKKIFFSFIISLYDFIIQLNNYYLGDNNFIKNKII